MTSRQKIKKSLGISSIKLQVGNWSFQEKKGSDERGAEIDLVFDRDDDVIS